MEKKRPMSDGHYAQRYYYTHTRVFSTQERTHTHTRTGEISKAKQTKKK